MHLNSLNWVNFGKTPTMPVFHASVHIRDVESDTCMNKNVMYNFIFYQIWTNSYEPVLLQSQRHSSLVFTGEIHSRLEIWNIWKAQWKHSYLTFWFAGNAWAPTRNIFRPHQYTWWELHSSHNIYLWLVPSHYQQIKCQIWVCFPDIPYYEDTGERWSRHRLFSAGTRRHNNVVITSKRDNDVVIASCVRWERLFYYL